MKVKKQKQFKKTKLKKPQPELPWQTGKYKRRCNYTFHLPYSFLLLCKLWQTPPEEILADFMDNLSHGSWQRAGRDEAKKQLTQYIIAMGYGQQHYSVTDIQTIFAELDAIGMLFPNDNEAMRKVHVPWRNKYYNYWFNKWFTKYNRNDTGSTL